MAEGHVETAGDGGAQFAPELPESFLAEYNAARHSEFTRGMIQHGFQFVRSGNNGDDQLTMYFENRHDGTTAQLSIQRGPRYQSPAEIAAAQQAESEQR